MYTPIPMRIEKTALPQRVSVLRQGITLGAGAIALFLLLISPRAVDAYGYAEGYYEGYYYAQGYYYVQGDYYGQG